MQKQEIYLVETLDMAVKKKIIAHDDAIKILKAKLGEESYKKFLEWNSEYKS